MRTSAQNVALLLSLAVVATLACSKTQDTAPERRIFGDPPTIQSVDPSFSEIEAQAECDFSESVIAIFCGSGIVDVEPQTGTGWTKVIDPNDPDKFLILHSDTPTTVPGIIISGNYTELNLKANVVDPNSTPGNNNVLLVSASYLLPESNSETSLVMFDDGSEANFPYSQGANVPESCHIDIPNGVCECVNATYNIQSADQKKGDDLYTRRFVLLNRNTSLFLNDCIMRSRHVIGQVADAHATFEFKVEAVDRQGNLATWPNKLVAQAGLTQFACVGDSCGCCLLHAFSQQAELPECKGEPGMISPSSFPNGFCMEGIN